MKLAFPHPTNHCSPAPYFFFPLFFFFLFHVFDLPLLLSLMTGYRFGDPPRSLYFFSFCFSFSFSPF